MIKVALKCESNKITGHINHLCAIKYYVRLSVCFRPRRDYMAEILPIRRKNTIQSMFSSLIQEFFRHMHGDITIAGEELYSVIMALSSEGF